jgi:hypothetical protein
MYCNRVSDYTYLGTQTMISVLQIFFWNLVVEQRNWIFENWI